MHPFLAFCSLLFVLSVLAGVMRMAGVPYESAPSSSMARVLSEVAQACLTWLRTASLGAKFAAAKRAVELGCPDLAQNMWRPQPAERTEPAVDDQPLHPVRLPAWISSWALVPKTLGLEGAGVRAWRRVSHCARPLPSAMIYGALSVRAPAIVGCRTDLTPCSCVLWPG